MKAPLLLQDDLEIPDDDQVWSRTPDDVIEALGFDPSDNETPEDKASAVDPMLWIAPHAQLKWAPFVSDEVLEFWHERQRKEQEIEAYTTGGNAQGDDVPMVAKALIFDATGRVLLLRDPMGSRWELPGGHLQEGESPDQGLEREVLEETGLLVMAEKSQIKMAQFGENLRPVILFEIHTDGSQPVKLSHEHDSFSWARPGDANLLNLGAYEGFIPNESVLHSSVQDGAESEMTASVERIIEAAKVSPNGFRAWALSQLAHSIESAHALAENRLTLFAGRNAANAERPQIEIGAKEFAGHRIQLLGDFVDHVQKVMYWDQVNGGVENESRSDYHNRLKAAAKELMQGRGAVVAQTEAQAIYGHAAVSAANRSGMTGKRWITVGDDRVRETHTACEAQGVVPIGRRFKNGLLYPGDPSGGPEETINCRCHIEFVSSKETATLQVKAPKLKWKRGSQPGEIVFYAE